MKWNSKTTMIILVFSIISTILLLLYISYSVSEKNFDDLALGDKTTTIVDMLDGKQINYQNFMVDKNTTKPLIKSGKDFIFSFGNSQSHSLNSYKVGEDHLFIYYVAKKFLKYNVINLSAPNANFQEMFLGLVNVEKVFGKKIKTVFFSMVFDDTREDGIRPKMASLIQDNENILLKYASGKHMLGNMDGIKKENNSTNDTLLLKFRAENTLNSFAEEYSEIYESRGKIRSQLYAQLYFFRNWVFGINPTSKRKKIDVAYARNFTALKDIVIFCKSHNIELFFYIAPLRQDIGIPYVKSQYDNFKKDVSEIHQTYNFESIVPGKYWGETNGDWVDFMHFKGEGHILLAKEFEKVLRKEGGK